MVALNKRYDYCCLLCQSAQLCKNLLWSDCLTGSSAYALPNTPSIQITSLLGIQPVTKHSLKVAASLPEAVIPNLSTVGVVTLRKQAKQSRFSERSKCPDESMSCLLRSGFTPTINPYFRMSRLERSASRQKTYIYYTLRFAKTQYPETKYLQKSQKSLDKCRAIIK
jgi:hypothetical protein